MSGQQHRQGCIVGNAPGLCGLEIVGSSPIPATSRSQFSSRWSYSNQWTANPLVRVRVPLFHSATAGGRWCKEAQVNRPPFPLLGKGLRQKLSLPVFKCICSVVGLTHGSSGRQFDCRHGQWGCVSATNSGHTAKLKPRIVCIGMRPRFIAGIQQASFS